MSHTHSRSRRINTTVVNMHQFQYTNCLHVNHICCLHSVPVLVVKSPPQPHSSCLHSVPVLVVKSPPQPHSLCLHSIPVLVVKSPPQPHSSCLHSIPVLVVKSPPQPHSLCLHAIPVLVVKSPPQPHSLCLHSIPVLVVKSPPQPHSSCLHSIPELPESHLRVLDRRPAPGAPNSRTAHNYTRTQRPLLASEEEIRSLEGTGATPHPRRVRPSLHLHCRH